MEIAQPSHEEVRTKYEASNIKREKKLKKKPTERRLMADHRLSNECIIISCSFV
jgi:hypothetical protein